MRLKKRRESLYNHLLFRLSRHFYLPELGHSSPMQPGDIGGFLAHRYSHKLEPLAGSANVDVSGSKERISAADGNQSQS